MISKKTSKDKKLITVYLIRGYRMKLVRNLFYEAESSFNKLSPLMLTINKKHH